MGKKLKIFLVDDHEMILYGLKSVIESTDRYIVTGSATDGLSALKSITELSPDIVLMDFSIPKLDGLAVSRKLMEQKNHAKIIILTSFSDDMYIREAMEIKVNGFILKENSSDELIHALDTVAAGYKYITPKIMTRIVDGLPDKKTDSSSVLTADSFTKREYQILRLIAEGKKGREICSTLNIGESTMKTHKGNLMKKINVSSTNELMLFVFKNGMFSIPED